MHNLNLERGQKSLISCVELLKAIFRKKSMEKKETKKKWLIFLLWQMTNPNILTNNLFKNECHKCRAWFLFVMRRKLNNYGKRIAIQEETNAPRVL